jgi:hypothetical protein
MLYRPVTAEVEGADSVGSGLQDCQNGRQWVVTPGDDREKRMDVAA